MEKRKKRVGQKPEIVLGRDVQVGREPADSRLTAVEVYRYMDLGERLSECRRLELVAYVLMMVCFAHEAGILVLTKDRRMEMCRMMKVTEQTIHNAMSGLRRRGLVIKVTRGVYKFPEEDMTFGRPGMVEKREIYAK